jgi:hypothetical protein
MEQPTLDRYDAILVKGQPRFRLDRKMVPAAQVPADIQATLVKSLLGEVDVPTPPVSVPVVEGADFVQPVTIESIVAAEGLTPTTDKMPSSFEMQLIEQLEDVKAQLAERESGIKSATIFELAQEMYQRFGVYTVFINQPPKDEDIHPFSGDIMTRYEVGLAYQKHNQVIAQGKLTRDYGAQYAGIEASRQASVTHAATIEENRQMTDDQQIERNTFDARTNLGAQVQSSMQTKARANDQISDEATPEPNLFGVTIRPDW